MQGRTCVRKKNLDPLCSKTSSEGKIRIFSEHFRKIQKSCGNDKIKRQGRVIASTLIHTASYINKHHWHFSNSNRSSSGEKLEMVVPDLKVKRVWKKLWLIFSFLFFPLLLSLTLSLSLIFLIFSLMSSIFSCFILCLNHILLSLSRRFFMVCSSCCCFRLAASIWAWRSLCCCKYLSFSAIDLSLASDMAASACSFCVRICSSTMRLMFLWSSMCFSSRRIIWDT